MLMYGHIVFGVVVAFVVLDVWANAREIDTVAAIIIMIKQLNKTVKNGVTYFIITVQVYAVFATNALLLSP